MKIYTKHGDDGSTGLLGGQRLSKDDVRVTAYGTVDELDSVVGLAAAACDDPDTRDMLCRIQGALLMVGSELATQPGRRPDVMIDAGHAAQLERWIDEISDELDPLTGFILPGGSEAASRLHVARTVCRRAERAVVTLARAHPVRQEVSVYLNRLSDLLFTLARRMNRHAGLPDVLWSANRPPQRGG
jgi:cob(I)alamin adenosyltransferase